MARSIFIVATVFLFAVLGIVVAQISQYDIVELAFFGSLGGLCIALIALLFGRERART